MKARKVIIIVCVCALLATACGIAAWLNSKDKYYIPEDLSPTDSYYDEANETDDNLNELIGVTNRNGSTAENLKCGGLAAVQGDWVYFGKDSLMKENIYTGERVELLVGQSTVSNIAVCGAYVYFVLDGSEIYRTKIDGDGSDLEFLQMCEGVHWTFYFEDEYLYFEKPTQTGSSSYSYTLSRFSANDVNNVEEIYFLSDYETLVGVYQGYAVIINKYEPDSFILYNIAAKQSKTVTNNYNFKFESAKDFHFDQGNIIYINDNNGVLVYNIESGSFTSNITIPYPINIKYVCDGKYYFYMGDYYSSKIHGYIMLNWIDGENTEYVKLGQEELDLVNVVNDKIYLYDRLGKKTLYRTNIDGSNWETLSY